MGLDIRLPIGAMFLVIGGLLTVYGIIADKAIYVRSLEVNVNLWWGLILLAFGGIMFWLGRSGSSSVRSSDESVEGRRTEEREHRKGLEH